MEKHATIICKVETVGNLQEVKKLTGKSIYKKPITIVFADGRTMYPELRNKNIQLFDIAGIVEGDDVMLDIMFEGSEKKGIRYNNVNIVKAKKI